MFEPSTRRGFGEQVARAGLGLVGLLTGCSRQRGPSWKEVKPKYAAAIANNQRVQIGGWGDFDRWAQETSTSEERTELVKLWITGESGPNVNQTYQKIVLPGIQRYMDSCFRTAMDAHSDIERYETLQNQVLVLIPIFEALDFQIKSYQDTYGTTGAGWSNDAFSPKIGFSVPRPTGERTIEHYHKPELDALKSELRGRSISTLTKQGYANAIERLGQVQDHVLKPTLVYTP